MTPPPADELVPRLFLGPALRAQSDQRLVRLVRDGYEAAFDEIMRRYGTALRRYASAIVGGRAEDVTQDAFSKALQALRRDEREIELRPWLYRIVRNTALNDIRDRHPGMVVLGEGIVGSQGVAEEVERREEVGELIERLRALPEPQRAAIVMRELEGLGHDEIAAALGVSDGAARQAIHRARTALRNGVGMAIPLPLLRAMLESAPSAEMAAGGVGGGVGAGLVLKAATATVLVAGSFGAGVALHQSRHAGAEASVATETAQRGAATAMKPSTGNDPTSGQREGHDDSTRHSSSSNDGGGASSGQASGQGPSRHSARSGSGGGERHSGSSPGGSGERNSSGPDDSGSRSGPDGGTLSGDSGNGSGSNSGPGSGGSGESGSGTSGPGGDGSGSGDLSGSGESLESNSGPGSGSDGSGGDGGSGSDSGESRDSSSGDGFSGQTQLQP